MSISAIQNFHSGRSKVKVMRAGQVVLGHANTLKTDDKKIFVVWYHAFFQMTKFRIFPNRKSLQTSILNLIEMVESSPQG